MKRRAFVLRFVGIRGALTLYAVDDVLTSVAQLVASVLELVVHVGVDWQAPREQQREAETNA